MDFNAFFSKQLQLQLTTMVVSVLHMYKVTPPQLPTMMVSVLRRYEVTPPQLPTMMVSVLRRYEVTPPQLPTMMVSVLMTTGPPPKVLMMSGTEQLTPPCWMINF